MVSALWRGLSVARAVATLVTSLALARTLVAQGPVLAERLGYPRDAKLLILHADDLGVAHSVDRASFVALESQAVSSASVMVPCPWLSEVAEYFKRKAHDYERWLRGMRRLRQQQM